MSSINSASFPQATSLVPDGQNPAQETAAGTSGGFLGLLDFINPLQHIPVVSTLYREATGDSISAVARIIGGGIFGGIPGLIASAADVVLTAATGQDAGETAIAALQDSASPTPQDTTTLVNDGAPLVSDQGQALMEVALAMKDASPAPDLIHSTAAEALLIPGGLAAYREPSLGLENEGRRDRLNGQLDEVALTF